MDLPFQNLFKDHSSAELPQVNLYPNDPFFDSLIGRVMRWLVGAGRHLIIFTELVVIVSFGSRFVLDRQLTDLNEQIMQKQAVAQSYGDLEQKFREAQQQVEDVQLVLEQQGQLKVMTALSKVTPPTVKYSSIDIDEGSVSLNGETSTINMIALLVENLKNNPDFQRITINQIKQSEGSDPVLEFSARFLYTPAINEFKGEQL